MTRTQNNTNTSKRKVLIGVWVEPVVRDELARRAQRNGLSMSATASALLKRALQQSIDMEYGALLEPVIQKAIARQMKVYSSRIAALQARVAFSAEQTRLILSEILWRLPGVTEEVRERILDWSANLAKQKITVKTPQLKKIIEEIERLFNEEPDKEEH